MQTVGYFCARAPRGGLKAHAWTWDIGRLASVAAATLLFAVSALIGDGFLVSEALAACVPTDSGGSPPGTYSGVTASIVCDGANDVITVIAPASTGAITLGAGDDTATVNGGTTGAISAGTGNDKVTINPTATFTGNVSGQAGNDLIILNGGTSTANFNPGTGAASVNDTDRMFMFGGTFLGSEAQVGSGKDPFFFFMGGEILEDNGGSLEVNRGSQNAVVVFDGGTLSTEEGIEVQNGNAGLPAGPKDPTIYFRSGLYEAAELELGGTDFGGANPTSWNIIIDPVNSKDPAFFAALANGATNGADPTLSTANLNQLLFTAPANPNADHQMIFRVPEIEFGDGNDTVTFNGAVNAGPGHHNLVLQGEEEEPGEFEPTEFAGGGGINTMNVGQRSRLLLGEIENFQFLNVAGASQLALGAEEYEFEEISVRTGSTLAFVSESGAVEVDAEEISVDGTSVLHIGTTFAELNVEHLELGGPVGGTSFKPSDQYRAFNPGGMLFIGPAGGDDDDEAEEDGDDDAGGGPARVVINTEGSDTVVNGGTINMMNGVTGDALGINGPYQSNGGKLAIDTQLGTKNSDTLVVNGPVAGTTTVYVNNTSEKNNQSAQKVVIAESPSGDFSKNSFKLGRNAITGQREVLDGAFAYQLASNNSTVYLVGDLLEQVPGYVTSPSVAQMHVLAEYGTLYQRMGEMRTYAAAGQPLKPEIWVRGSFAQKDVTASSGWDFDYDNDNILFGLDPGGWFGLERVRVGVFAGYGNTDATVKATSFGRQANSSVDVNGWTEGIYVTYFNTDQPGAGFYFDGIVKANQLDLSIRPWARPVNATPDTDAFSGSAEIGYGFAFGNGWSLTPQGQLIGIEVNENSFTDAFGVNVSVGESTSVIGRFGLQLQDSIATASGGIVAPYAIINVYSNFDGETVSYVNGTRLASDIGGTWGTIGGGLTASLGSVFDAYASADYAFGDVQGWNGTVGLRAHW